VFKIFGSEREEDGSWRKLHNDELHSLYSSPYIVRVIKSGNERGETCSTYENKEKFIRNFVGKPQRKDPAWVT